MLQLAEDPTYRAVYGPGILWVERILEHDCFPEEAEAQRRAKD